jgi:hypothetical protein
MADARAVRGEPSLVEGLAEHATINVAARPALAMERVFVPRPVIINARYLFVHVAAATGANRPTT